VHTIQRRQQTIQRPLRIIVGVFMVQEFTNLFATDNWGHNSSLILCRTCCWSFVCNDVNVVQLSTSYITLCDLYSQYAIKNCPSLLDLEHQENENMRILKVKIAAFV
jgi:hypothetical protein